MEKLPLHKLKPPNVKGYELTNNNGKTRFIPKEPKFMKRQKEYHPQRKEDDFFNLKFIKDLI